jgi:thioredoxin-related protein
VVDASEAVVPTRVDGDDRRDLAERFDVVAYPTLLLLDPDGKEIRRHVGYLGVDSTAIFMSVNPTAGR